MSLPTPEQYKKCAAKWRGTYKGVSYELSHHGISDYQPKGTWCFYIFFDEAMFINAEDFAKYNLEPKITDWKWNVPAVKCGGCPAIGY